MLNGGGHCNFEKRALRLRIFAHKISMVCLMKFGFRRCSFLRDFALEMHTSGVLACALHVFLRRKCKGRGA